MGPSVALSSVKDGKLKMLAFGSEKRVPQFPDVPTIAETVPGYKASVSFGLFTAAGTPTDIIKKVNADVQKIVSDPKFQKKYLERFGCSRYLARSMPLPNIYARIRPNGARSSVRRTLRSNECGCASCAQGTSLRIRFHLQQVPERRSCFPFFRIGRVDGFELAAIDGNAGTRQQAHFSAKGTGRTPCGSQAHYSCENRQSPRLTARTISKNSGRCALEQRHERHFG
jgi:hypothetical protein